MAKGRLIIVRHCESEYNAVGKWTGLADVHLTKKGHKESRLVGEQLKDVKIDKAYCSDQSRSIETAQGILEVVSKSDNMIKKAKALNERDYGDYTGMNKWEVQKQVGDKEFKLIRRGWDHSIPNGETLKMVYSRTVPFYLKHILPKIRQGNNTLLVTSGNAIRSLLKYIEDISDEDIGTTEMTFGDILIFDVDDNGKKLKKSVRKIDITLPPA